MSPDFEQTMRDDETVDLRISTGSDKEMHYAAHQLLPDDVYLKQEDITPTLLHMLSKAFKAGWDEATILAGAHVTNMRNRIDSMPSQDVHVIDSRKNKVTLVPVFDRNRSDLFVCEDLIKPHNEYVYGYDLDNCRIFRQVDTSYLKFERRVSLLGISHTDVLLNSNIARLDDTLDKVIALDKVVFLIGGKVVTYDASFTKDYLFTQCSGGVAGILVLTKEISFRTYSHDNTSVEHVFLINSVVDIDIADINTSIVTINGYATPLGYSIKANRIKGGT